MITVFEAAELGRKLSKQEYSDRVPALRTELLAAQRELAEAGFSMLVLLGGMDGAGRSETANLLHSWMDARFLTAHAFGPPSEQERDRPEFWRYWMSLPPAGRTGIYIDSWYTARIVQRTFEEIDDDTLDASMHRIANLERMLADDGILVVKLWLHIGKKRQGKRLRKLAKNPLTRWRVDARQKELLRRYDQRRRAAERALRLTSTGQTPWTVIEADNVRYRNVAVALSVQQRLAQHLHEQREAPAVVLPPTTVATNGSLLPTRSILDQLDLSRTIEDDAYDAALTEAQETFARLALEAQQAHVSTTLVFEGWDAAGKGGCIRRLIRALDARFYRVIPIAAPTDEERSHHYLWRFWRHIPRAGHMTIYDRSWYGRVLVERVEELATPTEWGRAYKEINDFEEQLVDRGIVLLKFWLHISQDEQLRRFEERTRTPWKQHKITDEDWRNRERAPQYEVAVTEMVERTSTEYAPWTLVAAQDKHSARIEVLQTVCAALRGALDRAKASEQG